ncbi:uncharacterized protein VDAG_06048 [Verticillium dahliae VdLs.17]|uniref:Uncharacterized protein n=2 Tax=Verticillium dahliae TaxID=27337 RepID=G2X8A7_VERDV|nr:uncharacterized protein VDAG_06048 [Verticillium dahliae VdLs.17]EGY15194.1 hypothetical protein VDAG_06048 [Verticillium dahliae VdLs.17]KAH6697831.1 hypothetical protein EV126DRAFT_388009 [Verticillium dahliae]PNH35725.1 hypothetical protein BJF96_g709 [Verticillium dahliae]PNH55923.1 hypothetical protein VD0003_g1754 [Verticillium dahliae]
MPSSKTFDPSSLSSIPETPSAPKSSGSKSDDQKGVSGNQHPFVHGPLVERSKATRRTYHRPISKTELQALKMADTHAPANDSTSRLNPPHPAAHTTDLPPENPRRISSQSRRSESGAPPQPSLDPAGFFTLVTNTKFGATASTSQQTHHPRVQYIFADDDPAVLTAALADSHARNQAASSSSSSSHSASKPKNHAILVDVAPVEDGKTGDSASWRVTSASSLSGDFAVTDARITRIEDSSAARGPKADAEGQSDAEEDDCGALMLKIEGVEMTGDDTTGVLGESLPGSQSSVKSGGGGKEDYAALLDEFDKHMVILKKVVAAGEERAVKTELVHTEEASPPQQQQQREGLDEDQDDQAEAKAHDGKGKGRASE